MPDKQWKHFSIKGDYIMNETCNEFGLKEECGTKSTD